MRVKIMAQINKSLTDLLGDGDEEDEDDVRTKLRLLASLLLFTTDAGLIFHVIACRTLAKAPMSSRHC